MTSLLLGCCERAYGAHCSNFACNGQHIMEADARDRAMTCKLTVGNPPALLGGPRHEKIRKNTESTSKHMWIHTDGW